MTPIKLLIAYPSALLSESLAHLLHTEESLQVCTPANDSADLLSAAEAHHPDVVLIHPDPADNTAADKVQVLKDRYPAMALLVLAGSRDDALTRSLIRAGASGFVCTGRATSRELVQAIHAVHAGRSWLPRALQPPPKAPCSCLTQKEREILHLVCCQKSSKQIADEVGLTRRSVEVYRNKINEKLGVANAVGAALYAVKHGIFKV